MQMSAAKRFKLVEGWFRIRYLASDRRGDSHPEDWMALIAYPSTRDNRGKEGLVIHGEEVAAANVGASGRNEGLEIGRTAIGHAIVSLCLT